MSGLALSIYWNKSAFLKGKYSDHFGDVEKYCSVHKESIEKFDFTR